MIGSSSDPREMDKWYRESLPAARKVLEAFPTLNAFFNGFEGYESKTYLQSRNFVLVNCLPGIGGKLATDQLVDLAEFERALETFSVKHWAKLKLDTLMSRMRSDSFDDGLSVFTEFRIANRLCNAFGKENVEMYPKLSNGKISDVAVLTDGNRLFIEIGNLSYSEPERIIQRVLNAGANNLRHALPGNRYMQVEVDTARFVFDDNGRMEEQRTIEKLNDEVDKLALNLLASLDCNIDIKMAAEIVRNISAYRTTRRFLDDYFGEAVDALDNGSLSNWARTASFGTVNEKTLVESVICGQAKSPLLEFHSKGFYPSRSADAESTSFANHIVRSVRSQIESEQIERKAPNIILVQGYNWVASIVDEISTLKKVFSAVHEMFSNMPDVAGIGFFSRHPSDGYYMHNSVVAVCESEKSVVGSLQLRLVD